MVFLLLKMFLSMIIMKIIMYLSVLSLALLIPKTSMPKVIFLTTISGQTRQISEALKRFTGKLKFV